jgi:hypothetical protein
MRKNQPKLALRKETLRALSKLTLARVIGGQGDDAVVAADATFGRTCPAPAVAPPA